MRLWSITAGCGLLYGSLGFAESNFTSSQSTQQILQGDFKPPKVFENTNLVRTTNLEKGYVRETINVVVTNIDKSPQSDYYIPFENGVMGKVGGMEVRDKKNTDKGIFEVSTAAAAAVPLEEGIQSSSSQYYIVHFPDPLPSKSQITLSISYNILSALVPLPASIEQTDKQYLTYAFSAYFPTPYRTIKQKTKVKFPSADVPDYTTTTGLTSSSDPERQGSSFTYGPYETTKVPAGTLYPVSVRYEFTKPVLVSSLLDRSIEVSHLGGNLAVEENYYLRNDGAKLANHFSRVTWATQNYYMSQATSALKELNVPLKPGSVDPYFTDDIGNVSTSRYRPTPKNALNRDASLELKPRYPLFGGWYYSFRIGWNNALSSFLRKVTAGASNTYALTVPLLEGPKMPEGISYEQFVLHIILPEGASNVRWETVGGTGAPILSEEMGLHKTFLDTVGRTEIKLSAVNVVDEAREVQVVVLYEYTWLAGMRKPATIFVGMLGVFVAAWVISSVDVSIGKKG